MSRGVNEITLIGNLGQDPEVKFTQSGMAVCNLRLAVSENRKVNGEYTDVTEWFNVTVFGKSAESIGQYLNKGSKLYVQGRGQSRTYEKKDGSQGYAFEVVANRTVFLDPPNRGGQSKRGNELQRQTPPQKQGGNDGFYDDSDLPF